MSRGDGKRFPALEAKERAIREAKEGPCTNCGQPGRHFVPPSMGEPGFYVCTAPFFRKEDELP